MSPSVLIQWRLGYLILNSYQCEETFNMSRSVLIQWRLMYIILNSYQYEEIFVCLQRLNSVATRVSHPE